MAKTLIERFLSGEQEGVWQEIYLLQSEGKSLESWENIEPVLVETMERVKFNLDTIYERLIISNYKFKDPKNARRLPVKSDENLLQKLKESINKFGHIPSSLEYFHKIVGSVNFIPSWDEPPYIYRYADPIYIENVKVVYDLCNDESWEENMEDLQIKKKRLYIEISPDFYHKDNVSGGLPYGIEITKSEQIDSLFLNNPYGKNLYFIQYLRLCFASGGFPLIAKKNKNYQKFIDFLKNGLKKI